MEFNVHYFMYDDLMIEVYNSLHFFVMIDNGIKSAFIQIYH